MLTERKFKTNNSVLNNVSLPHVFKGDILKKARDLRIKVDRSMNISRQKTREPPHISPNNSKNEGVIEMKLKLRYLKNSKSTDKRSKLQFSWRII